MQTTGPLWQRGPVAAQRGSAPWLVGEMRIWPRKHITVESISTKAILHRMKFIVVLYSYESLMEMRLASLLNAIVADGPQSQMWMGQGECCL